MQLCLIVNQVYTSVRTLIALIFSVLVVTSSTIAFVWPLYSRIQAYPATNAPATFVREFEPETMDPVHLDFHCEDFALTCYNGFYSSPFFPYLKLHRTQINGENCQYSYVRGKEINLSTEGRYLRTDPFWKLFWIEIVDCFKPAKFYGPFRVVS